MSATDTNQGGGSGTPDGPDVPDHDGAPVAMVHEAEVPAEDVAADVDAADDPVQSSPLRILAVLAALAAGLYPAWRVGRLAPAVYLKTQ